MRTLPRASVVLLAMAVSFAGTRGARADGPKDDAAVRSKRHGQLAQTQADLGKFCDTVRGWKVAAPGAVDADLAVLSDPKSSPEDRRAAAKHVHDVDSDSAGLGEDKRQELARDVDKARESCGELEDEDAGLPALTAEGAKLEKISQEHWDHLTDKLGAILVSFQGNSSFGETSNQSYANCYGHGCKSKAGQQFGRQQLASDAEAQFTTDFERVLPDAVGDVSPPKPASSDGDD